MLKVTFGGPLQSAVGDIESTTIFADSILELLRKLVERFPNLEPLIKSGIAVAINGEIYRDNWDVPIPANAEVFLLPRIQGG